MIAYNFQWLSEMIVNETMISMVFFIDIDLKPFNLLILYQTLIILVSVMLDKTLELGHQLSSLYILAPYIILITYSIILSLINLNFKLSIFKDVRRGTLSIREFGLTSLWMFVCVCIVAILISFYQMVRTLLISLTFI